MSGRQRLLTVQLVVLGLGLAVVGAIGVVALLTGGAVDAIDYARAGPCPAGVVAAGCWSEVPATVVGTRFAPTRRGPDQWEVTITDRMGTQRLDVQHREVFNQLRSREPVVARFWNGRPILIHVGAEDLVSEQTPGADLTLAVLVALLLPGGLLLVAWTLWSARPEVADRQAARLVRDAMVGRPARLLGGWGSVVLSYVVAWVALASWLVLGLDALPVAVVAVAVVVAATVGPRLWLALRS